MSQNAALRAAYAQAMQDTPSPSPTTPAAPTAPAAAPFTRTETPAEASNGGTSPPPGASVAQSPPQADLPVIAGIDLSKLGLTPSQVALLAEQTRRRDDMDLGADEPAAIPVRKADGSVVPAAPAEGDVEEPTRATESKAEEPPSQAEVLLDLVSSDPELTDLVLRKYRERAIGVPPQPAGPKRLTPEEYEELSLPEQRAYEHRINVEATTERLAPILGEIRRELRDIKQAEQDRAVIAEKHGDFAALPKDHHLRGLVEDLRREMPSLTLVQAVEKAKALQGKFITGAKREIQASAARSATANVHKPETAQTRELELDASALRKQGRSRGEILRALFDDANRKRGVDV